MVRAAVLKGKDPQQILEEMEKIDQMGTECAFLKSTVFNILYFLEYNVNQPSPLNEKVLKDKRKKLKETLDRVLSMYVSIKQNQVSNLFTIIIFIFCSIRMIQINGRS